MQSQKRYRVRHLWVGVCAFAVLGGSANAQSLYPISAKSQIRMASVMPMQVSQSSTSIEKSIALALQHNPQISVAEAQNRGARSERFRAFGQFLPSIEGSALYASEDLRSSTLDSLQDRDGLTLGVSVRQPIFTGLSTFNSFREQRAKVRASEHNFTNSKVQVGLLAAQVHGQVVLSREIVRHRKENLKLVGRQLEITQARMKAGAQSRTGVEQARMRAAQAEVALQQAKAEQAAREAAYESIVGEKPALLSSARDGDISIAPETLSDALETALRNNPSLNAARESVSASNYARLAARGAFSPDLSIEGNFNTRFTEDLGETSEEEYQIVARMRVPLFVQGQNQAGLRLASSQAAEQKAQLNATRLSITETTNRVWRAREAALARQSAAEDAISAAELSVKGLQIEFEAGQRTVIDVLDGQRDLVNTKISLSQANFDLLLASYELAAVLGQITGVVTD